MNKESSHLSWAGLCISSSHRPPPPAAHTRRAPRHCETASLSAWTARRNSPNSQHVRASPGWTWVWRNLKSLPFSSSFHIEIRSRQRTALQAKSFFLKKQKQNKTGPGPFHEPAPSHLDNAEGQTRTAVCKKTVSLSFNDKEKENEGLKKYIYIFFTPATWCYLVSRTLTATHQSKIKIN